MLLDVLVEMPAGTRGWLSLTCADGVDDPCAASDVDRGLRAGRAGRPRWSPSASTARRPSTSRRWCAAAVAASGKPAVAYPNSGEAWDARDAVLGRRRCRRRRRRGAALGRRRRAYVGGCCRVGATDIARLAESCRTVAKAQIWRRACLVGSPTVGLTARSSSPGSDTQTRNAYGCLISPIAWPEQRAV